jgi:SAM-dependent methyltransferase
MTSVTSDRGADHRAIWNDAFDAQPGLLAKCPYDYVASFLFRFRPADKAPAEVDVCEVGFGSGANLLFAAQQGFRVSGVDVSDRALVAAIGNFTRAGLSCDLRRSPFSPLPFGDAAFDLAFDRSSISCVSLDEAMAAVREVRRTLRPGGCFLFNPYSVRDSAATEEQPSDLSRTAWQPMMGRSRPTFYSEDQVRAVLSGGWKLHELVHVAATDEASPDRTCRAQWRAIAEAV